ncbi:hypothetical protein QE385_002860 [Sphingomonas sp. SORGH_AS 950]|uniref:hypothetical protein n=1 Tax=Sphingomonas sp. SORGH_AS_0950 TaxID=3041792 RepID=UPI0027843D73|nr:hypothetical protein [Sphingomonas sp. SORGH_AS_0950]MDQ1158533.1 hypothetical protein [Sphingomonas sp. SORGH_AS_0950]
MTDIGAERDFVLLIDDEETQMKRLTDAVEAALAGTGVAVRCWMPRPEDKGLERLEALTAEKPLLAVTDYDLTRGGKTGLFGFSIVAFAQKEAIPVGDYSRQLGALTDEPDVFEFRLPDNADQAAPIIASVALGFRWIRDQLLAKLELLDDGSPASLLADLLGQPDVGSAFSLYSSRLTSGNSALIQMLRNATGHRDEVRVRIASYVAGHLLFNSIMRYPGPILHSDALHAYFATSPTPDAELDSLLAASKYDGPFSAIGPFYWQTKIDDIIEKLAVKKELSLGQHDPDETFDQFRRRVAEIALNRQMERHDCARCGGERGGYWCPLTKRPVCDRSDCSVPSSSWIPEGAYLTRVECDFYEEWATLIGL